MPLEEYKNKVLSDDEFVLEETRKILYLYTLKHTIRYGQNRHDQDYTESVAEHIWGMHIIADYFLLLEDPKCKLNRQKIALMTTWHEAGEIETGDIPSVRKTEADRIKERELLETVIQKSPKLLTNQIKMMTDEYEDQLTSESKFVKAIDKIEPLIHSFHPLGKGVQHELQLPASSSIESKRVYIESYPTIKRFSEVLHAHMDKNGFFYPEN